MSPTLNTPQPMVDLLRDSSIEKCYMLAKSRLRPCLSLFHFFVA